MWAVARLGFRSASLKNTTILPAALEGLADEYDLTIWLRGASCQYMYQSENK